MIDSHAGLFAASFQVHTLVQVFFVIQCIWTGVMGVLVTYRPTLSPINDTGVFVRKGSDEKEEFVHPNVRGAWCVRGGSMFLVAAGALFFGTRETYLEDGVHRDAPRARPAVRSTAARAAHV